MAVDPNYRTLRRRSKELLAAAGSDIDEYSKALFLFYAVECGLKAFYLQIYRLATTSAEGSRARSARSFGHRLDDLIVALRIAASKVPPRPPQLALRNGTKLQVFDLHEAWRYGERIEAHAEVVMWLDRIAGYVKRELG
ncbi:MAG: hypothetical protein ACREE9_03250 [Stellaceae bacterium]